MNEQEMQDKKERMRRRVAEMRMGNCALNIIRSLEDWLDLYEKTGGGINPWDVLITEGIVEAARGARMLLNGPTGDHDCGSLDGRIVTILVRCGVEGAE